MKMQNSGCEKVCIICYVRRLLDGLSGAHMSPDSWLYSVCIKMPGSRCFWIRHVLSTYRYGFQLAYLSQCCCPDLFGNTPPEKSLSCRFAFPMADGFCGFNPSSFLCVCFYSKMMYSVTFNFRNVKLWSTHPVCHSGREKSWCKSLAEFYRKQGKKVMLQEMSLRKERGGRGKLSPPSKLLLCFQLSRRLQKCYFIKNDCTSQSGNRGLVPKVS